MAVIVTDMDMPKNCQECYLSWQDDYYTENPPLKCNLVYCPTGLDRNAKHEDCPLKSIAGLIEFIRESKALRCMGATKQVFIEEKDLFRIIKEYCGGELE